MPAFRKKPIVIEAVRIYEPLIVATPEGDMHAQAGDWIIKGVKGEVYPCKDDIFRQTYEPVGKEGVKALAAPGPNDSEDCGYILPFPCDSAPTILETTIADTLS